MRNEINKIKLPKDSRNEQLELISKNHFRPLFDVTKFILKEEVIDNGIDYRIELKDEGNKLGFGLNFQLKSSEKTKQNNDGSYSKPIETSNIEYLLNNGQTAYYGFYIVNENKFYFESLKNIIYELDKRDSEWQNQNSHSVRFSKLLNLDAIKEIYEETIKDGILIRKLHSKLAEKINDFDDKNNKLIIDFKGNFETDEEIENFINDFGLYMNDNCKWKEILTLHNKTSTGSKKSARYNFVIGLSFLYLGSYLQSLDFLRKAYFDKDSLNDDIKSYLTYYHAELCLLFRLMNEEEYKKEIDKACNNLNLSYYIELSKIEEIKIEMFSSENFQSEKFEKKIIEFIDNKKIDLRIRYYAKLSLLNYKAEKLVCQAPYLLAFSNLEYLNYNFVELNKDFRDVLTEIENSSSNILVYNCTLNHNRFLIQFDAVYKLNFIECLKENDVLDIITSILSSYNYFLEIGHMHNQVYSLSILLEAYQTIEDETNIKKTIKKLEELSTNCNDSELKNKIEFIKNGGTFVNFIINKRNESQKLKEEIDKMREELIEIDRSEIKQNITHDQLMTIHLFPIGYFQFPKNKIEKVFEILEIEEQNLKSHFLELFEFVIPMVNIYTEKIESEGPLNGNLEYRGIESFRKIYKVRKLFFENNFNRIEIKF